MGSKAERHSRRVMRGRVRSLGFLGRQKRVEKYRDKKMLENRSSVAALYQWPEHEHHHPNGLLIGGSGGQSAGGQNGVVAFRCRQRAEEDHRETAWRREAREHEGPEGR